MDRARVPSAGWQSVLLSPPTNPWFYHRQKSDGHMPTSRDASSMKGVTSDGLSPMAVAASDRTGPGSTEGLRVSAVLPLASPRVPCTHCHWAPQSVSVIACLPAHTRQKDRAAVYLHLCSWSLVQCLAQGVKLVKGHQKSHHPHWEINQEQG